MVDDTRPPIKSLAEAVDAKEEGKEVVLVLRLRALRLNKVGLTRITNYKQKRHSSGSHLDNVP